MIFSIVAPIVNATLYKTGQESDFDTFGTWMGAYSELDEIEVVQYTNQTDVDCGIAEVVGNVLDEGNNPIALVGSLDEALISIGRLDCISGHFPVARDEIAMEVSTLSQLGYTYELGQTITLTVRFVRDDGTSILDTQRYRLCGIVKSYSDFWVIASPSVLISSSAAERYAERYYQVFLRGTEDYSTFLNGYLSTSITLNSLVYGGSRESTLYFYQGVILALTFLALVLISSVQMRKKTRQIALLRAVAATPSQVTFVQVCRSLLLILPAAVLGGLLAYPAMKTALALMFGLSGMSYYLDIPLGSVVLSLLVWCAASLGGMLLPVVSALRTPLLGAFRETRSTTKWRKRMTGLFSVAFTALLVVIFLYTLNTAVPAYLNANLFLQYKDYTFTPAENLIDKEIVTWLDERTETDLVWGTTRIFGSMTFEGMENSPLAQRLMNDSGRLPVTTYTVSPSAYDFMETQLTGEYDMEAFLSGSGAFVFVPLYGIDETEGALTMLGTQVDDTLTCGSVIELNGTTVRVAGMIHADLADSRGDTRLSKVTYDWYTVFVSDAFVETEGFDKVWVWANTGAEYLATDYVFSTGAKEYGATLSDNSRAYYQNSAQSYLKTVFYSILLGATLILIIFIIDWNLHSTYMEQTRCDRYVLLTLGLPRRALALYDLLKCSGKTVFSFLIGTLAYLGWYALKNPLLYAEYQRLGLWAWFRHVFEVVSTCMPDIFLLSAIALAVLVLLANYLPVVRALYQIDLDRIPGQE